MRGWALAESTTAQPASARYMQAPFDGSAVTLLRAKHCCRGQPARPEFLPQRSTRNESVGCNFLAHVEPSFCARADSVPLAGAVAVDSSWEGQEAGAKVLRHNIPEASAPCFAAVPRRYRYACCKHQFVPQLPSLRQGRRHIGRGSFEKVNGRDANCSDPSYFDRNTITFSSRQGGPRFIVRSRRTCSLRHFSCRAVA